MLPLKKSDQRGSCQWIWSESIKKTMPKNNLGHQWKFSDPGSKVHSTRQREAYGHHMRVPSALPYQHGTRLPRYTPHSGLP
mmetsp:Transcript_22978/g.40741  ORF Transcript_22978/g.40741 Transcript_22978/m.40741 type:complete len:81 (+) Transcript_22978:451-693(+)